MSQVVETPVVETSKGASLNDAISSAMAEVDKGLENPAAETVVEPETPAAAEIPKEAIVNSEDELTIQGRQLMLALNDPSKRDVVIKFLAEQSGYTKAETKAEIKEAKDEITELLKANLGSEFDFLAEKLAPAISKVVEASLEKNTKEIKDRFQQQETERIQNIGEKAITDLSTEFFGKADLPQDVQKEMTRLMDTYNPGRDQSIADYVGDMFRMATSKLGLSKISSKTSNVTRINQNRSDAAGRLVASGGVSPSEVIETTPKAMTLDQSIKAAMETADKLMEKKG